MPAHSTTPSFEFQFSIPVLRMFDEAKTKAFYIDYLGFTADWEHRFAPADPNSPLYMQIRRGSAVLHLDGHKTPDGPAGEVRIPVQGLANYCQWLGSKEWGQEKPTIADPRYTGTRTDMTVVDPSGNTLIFWLAEDA